MEKIQQAIERARQQRATVTGHSVRTGSKPGLGAPAGATTAADLNAVRSVTLDPDHLRQTRVVAANVDEPNAEVFRTLRTQVLLRLEALGGRSVAIVSARDGEGKTLVATNLAISLARRAEAPVFLVDFDFRRPSVHRTLGLEPELGVADYIENSTELDRIILNVDGTNLYLLPQPKSTTHASELIGSSRARGLLGELSTLGRGGYIVIDCPPLLLTDEPLAVQRFVDSCLLVVRAGRTKRDEVSSAAELLDETKYLGSVLNQTDTAAPTQYYGYK